MPLLAFVVRDGETGLFTLGRGWMEVDTDVWPPGSKQTFKFSETLSPYRPYSSLRKCARTVVVAVEVPIETAAPVES